MRKRRRNEEEEEEEDGEGGNEEAVLPVNACLHTSPKKQCPSSTLEASPERYFLRYNRTRYL
jgi:hypothetical protein